MIRFQWMKEPGTRGYSAKYHGLFARVSPEPGYGWQWFVMDRENMIARGTSFCLDSAKGRAYDVTRGEHQRLLAARAEQGG